MKTAGSHLQLELSCGTTVCSRINFERGQAARRSGTRPAPDAVAAPAAASDLGNVLVVCRDTLGAKLTLIVLVLENEPKTVGASPF